MPNSYNERVKTLRDLVRMFREVGNERLIEHYQRQLDLYKPVCYRQPTSEPMAAMFGTCPVCGQDHEMDWVSIEEEALEERGDFMTTTTSSPVQESDVTFDITTDTCAVCFKPTSDTCSRCGLHIHKVPTGGSESSCWTFHWQNCGAETPAELFEATMGYPLVKVSKEFVGDLESMADMDAWEQVV